LWLAGWLVKSVALKWCRKREMKSISSWNEKLKYKLIE